MGNAHSEYCRKEKEIAETHADVVIIKKIVMGNGKDGLVTTVPKLTQGVDTLNLTMLNLERGLKGFLKYQQTMEGKHDGKAEMKKRTRWVIGLLVGVILVLIGGLISTIHLLAQ